MKRVAIPILTLIAVTALAYPTRADVVTFEIPPGTLETVGNHPVSATATITTSTDTVTIVITNTQPNPISVSQNISGLEFTLSTTPSGSSSITSSSGVARTVASGGSFSDGASVSTGWALSAAGATLTLNLLGTATAPEHTIIGPPGGATYSAANSSIAGNVPHNPFLDETATFVLHVPGVTDSTSATDLAFLFNTAAGSSVPGETTPVPEPGSAVLLGFGLLAVGGALKQRLLRRH
jgi:PEP-CTERM motif